MAIQGRGNHWCIVSPSSALAIAGLSYLTYMPFFSAWGNDGGAHQILRPQLRQLRPTTAKASHTFRHPPRLQVR